MKNVNNLMSQINLKEKQLEKINFKRIDKEPEKEEIEVDADTSYEIIELTNDTLKIKTETVVRIIPEAFFTANISYIIEYKLFRKITENEVKNNINKFIRIIGSDLSVVLSILTEKTLGFHFVLPPNIFFSDTTD